jgi:hypothetical protein
MKFPKVTRSKLILALRSMRVGGLVYKSDLLVPSATEGGEEPDVNALEDVVLQDDGQYLAHYGTQLPGMCQHELTSFTFISCATFWQLCALFQKPHNSGIGRQLPISELCCWHVHMCDVARPSTLLKLSYWLW